MVDAPAVPENTVEVPGLTVREEWANFWTHLLGLLLSLAGSFWLLKLAAQTNNLHFWIGSVIFSATMICVYAASTLSHAFYQPQLRRFFRILDQAFIYLFISGTYTPLALVYLDGFWWNLLLVAMWAIAILGFLSKTVLVHRIEGISTKLYVLQGWLPATTAIPITRHIPEEVLWWMLAGGICYTVGVLFLKFDHKVRYFHAVWHLLVIAGSACHGYAIALYGLRLPT